MLVNGHTLTYQPKDAATRVRDVVAAEVPVRKVALQLRQWGTT
ncbi:hypothetical protein [Streptomyces sp. NPDC001070]